VPPFFGGRGTPSSTMWPGQRPTSVPSVILIHPAVWPQYTFAKNWGLCLFGEEQLGPHLMSLGPKTIYLPSGILIHPTIWPQQIWAKNWGLCPFGGGVADTMWQGRGLHARQVILICPTVWPQYTNVTDRTGQDRQRSGGIGRTVLQTVAQKSKTWT